MTLKQAVKALGGASNASRLSGVARTVIIYWIKNGVYKHRQSDADKIIALAEQRKAA